MFELKRRDFLKGCSAAAVVAGTRPGFAAALDANAATTDVLVVVFLRGAMDALSLVPPIGGNDRAAYEQARPSLKIPLSGMGAALTLANSGNLWGLHPRASGLYNLYQSGHVAVVLGSGQVNTPVTRSHFDAQANMEFGLGGSQSSGVGWLTRHLQSAGLPGTIAVPAVSMGSITAASLLSSTEAVTMGSGSDFRMDSLHWSWNGADSYTPSVPGLNGIVEVLPQLWQGSTSLEAAGRQTLEAMAQLRPVNFGVYDASSNPGGYAPAGGANYGSSGFGAQLRNVAQMVKSSLGLRIATVDLGGWDTHDGQGNPANTYDYFGGQVQILSEGLTAFYTDLAASAGNPMQRVSVVVMSEFGRRVTENDSGGTDHGYGSVMLAMGGAVIGGHVYGSFPGLGQASLFEGADLNVTTDYRRVLSEALIRRLGNNKLGRVFPSYTGYAPIGIFQGTDVAPDYTDGDAIFKNGFQ